MHSEKMSEKDLWTVAPTCWAAMNLTATLTAEMNCLEKWNLLAAVKVSVIG